MKSATITERLPYTVLLFIAGAAIGLVAPKTAPIAAVAQVNPELLLTIFLPILVCAAAYSLGSRNIGQAVPTATILAGPGMIIAAAITAAIMYSTTEWGWHYAALFAALIAATDPVAVVAIMKVQRVKKSLERVVDAEAMLNDGTGIVLFTMAIAAVKHPIEEAATVIGAGAIIGAVAGLIFRTIVRIAEHRGRRIQAAALLALAYATYIVANNILHLSGVIALVVYAAVASHKKELREIETQRTVEKMWQLLEALANTLVFLWIGVVVAVKAEPKMVDIPLIAIAYAAVTVARAAMVAICYPWLKRWEKMNWRECIIVAWSGLRGAVALALALIVATTAEIKPELQREIIVVSAGVITLTLLINATTIKWLIKKLVPKER